MPIFIPRDAEGTLSHSPQIVHVAMKLADFSGRWHRSGIRYGEIELGYYQTAPALACLISQMFDNRLKCGNRI
ncbi:MAG TPA: hypothetical protein VEJ67_17180 [Candidatus Cybelea sp.]|nr:hypothetical protein [Candidatus Cybelea sp.]